MIFDTINPEDLETLREFRNDVRIRRWCRQLGLISYENQKAWYQLINTDSCIEMFAIRSQEGALLGACGLTDLNGLHRRAEFSLYIAPRYQRKGYARKALKKLLDYAFNDCNLNIVWGETFDNNPAIALFTSLGFVKEGTRRDFYFKEGRYIDAHLFSIKSEEHKSTSERLKKVF